MIIYHKNLLHAQELQKPAHNKSVKSKSYAPNEEVWLNSRYIKNQQNWKLEAKFFVMSWSRDLQITGCTWFINFILSS